MGRGERRARTSLLASRPSRRRWLHRRARPPRRGGAGSDQAGFTLVEAVVALGVFAVAVLALMQLLSSTVRHQTALQERTLASIVAENRLVELMAGGRALREEVLRGEAEQGGRNWFWTVTIAPAQASGLPDIMRMHVEVRTDEDTPRLVAEAVAFRVADPL